MSSLGKTTFCLQLADNLAAMGEHVLFFTFEQSRFELASKSLARLCQSEGKIIDSYPTSYDIRNGAKIPDETIQQYSEITEHKYTIECDFETTVGTIIEKINAHIRHYGVRPVVFIDYLQLVRSNNNGLMNTKDIIDFNVRALKQLQKRNNLLIFVISSINRKSYTEIIDLESFKESGEIENTADVVLGMQYEVVNEFYSKTTTEKRKAIKFAEQDTPRCIELCVLKNRYGASHKSFHFKYYPKWDLFIPELIY